jgi:CubicO group peptidase (beta-lactamase class C family)
MPQPNRRAFVAACGGAAVHLAHARGTADVDETLRSGIASRKIPCVVAMAAGAKRTLYTGAFGARDSSGVAVGADSIFQIASMTKAVTTVAALQLVEQGKASLTEPVSKYLPQLANLEVWDGQELRAAKTQVTLHHLLTHTSGFCYDTWDGDMFRYASQHPPAPGAKAGPLMFEPGTRWRYGQGCDWAGRLVEAITGATLERYFQDRIFKPLGMTDTSYILPPAKFDRSVTRYERQADGALKQNERKQPNPPAAFNGGGGLYSTAADYVRFMQAILNRGEGILKPKTVDSMMTNQIGALTAGKMRSYQPARSADVDIQPGHTEKWGYGFLINTTAYDGGRSAGSLAWAGLYNTFYWIDPKRHLCATILMQFLPFVDKEAVGLLADFEPQRVSNVM